MVIPYNNVFISENTCSQIMNDWYIKRLINVYNARTHEIFFIYILQGKSTMTELGIVQKVQRFSEKEICLIRGGVLDRVGDITDSTQKHRIFNVRSVSF